jgi:putative membrane protein
VKLATLPSITLFGLVTLYGAATVAAGLRGEEDGPFLMRAAEVSRQEANEARAAERSTRNTEIRGTAHSIADDHERASRQLADLAKKKGTSLPAGATNAAGAAGAAGAAKSQSDPERIAGLLKAHEDAVALFHKEAVRGTDPDLKSFAQTTLPTLQQRLMDLRTLQDSYPQSRG